MKTTNKILILTLLFIFSNCGKSEVEFSKQLWNKKIDGFYEHRENMTNDLLKNHLKKGMKYKNLIELIGEPQNYGTEKKNKIVYSVMENYGLDIDPVEAKILIITLSKDSLVDKYEILHWKK